MKCFEETGGVPIMTLIRRYSCQLQIARLLMTTLLHSQADHTFKGANTMHKFEVNEGLMFALLGVVSNIGS